MGSYISTAPVSAGVVAAGAAAAGVSVAAQAKSTPPASSAAPAVPEKTEVSQDIDADEPKPSLDSSLEDALVPMTPAPAPADVEDEVDHPADPIDHDADLKVVVSAGSAVPDPGMVIDSTNGTTSGVVVALPPVPIPNPSDGQPVDNGGDGGGGGTNVDVSAGTRSSVNAITGSSTSREIEVDFAVQNGDAVNSDLDGVSLTKIPSPIPEVPTPAPSSTVPTPSAATASNGTTPHVQNSMAPPLTPGVPSNVDDGRSARSSGTVSHSESSGTEAAAAQLKVFNRLCVMRGKGGNEAETGDAGGGGGEVGASKAERTLSFDQVRLTKG